MTAISPLLLSPAVPLLAAAAPPSTRRCALMSARSAVPEVDLVAMAVATRVAQAVDRRRIK
jgi:hypothetical protein